MNEVLDALQHDFADVLDVGQLTHLIVRMLAAALLGGLLGYEREKAGKAAGVRTHMLVAAGAAFFVIVPSFEGVHMGHVLQGIIAGIGFIGGGAILKLEGPAQIKGLTTAAGIWFTAAIGIAIGFGRLATALVATLLALLILNVVYRFEPKPDGESTSEDA